MGNNGNGSIGYLAVLGVALVANISLNAYALIKGREVFNDVRNLWQGIQQVRENGKVITARHIGYIEGRSAEILLQDKKDWEEWYGKFKARLDASDEKQRRESGIDEALERLRETTGRLEALQ